jgi:drug/metabolite transporter (DMT)-like permease
MLTIVFASSFVVTAIRITITKKWRQIFQQPLFLWLIGSAFICGSDLAYILGADCAPIAHVDLSDYLWPCFVVLFISLLPKEKFQGHQIVGALFGMLGVLILLTRGQGLVGFNLDFSFGYVLALYGALLWGAYAALSRHYNAAPTEMVGMYCGVGALVCFILHLACEVTVIPSGNDCFLSIFLGATGAGIAYQLWDQGVKFGNFRLLSSLTYLARVIGMLLLVMFGKEPFSWALVAAVVLSCVGIFLSSVENFNFRKIMKTIPNFYLRLRSSAVR